MRVLKYQIENTLLPPIPPIAYLHLQLSTSNCVSDNSCPSSANSGLSDEGQQLSDMRHRRASSPSRREGWVHRFTGCRCAPPVFGRSLLSTGLDGQKGEGDEATTRASCEWRRCCCQ
jgi:hypothetical protein